MAATTAKQLNYGISRMPIAFLAKDWRDNQDGAGNFKPKNRRRRLLSSRVFVLNAIHKIETVYDGLVKKTYKNIETLSGVKHTTIWQSLKELEAENKLKCHGESNYTIEPTFSEKEYIVIYDFLLNEILELNGKLAKQLSRNAVIYLCALIGFYLNPENKYAYFQGGNNRVASFLNVALGTASGIINELIDTKAIFSHAAKKDKNDNLIKIKNKQNGKSNAEFTIYEVNPKLLSRCRRIQEYYAQKRQQKAQEATQAKKAFKQAQEASEQSADIVTNEGEEIFIKPKKKKKSKAYNAQARQRQADLDVLKKLYDELDENTSAPSSKHSRRRDIIEEWASTIDYINNKRPPTDDNKE